MLKLYRIVLFLCIGGAVISAHGQESANCTQQMFDEAESSYLMRWRGSEIKGRAERELKELVQNCAASPERHQAEEHLTVVQEELAESSLLVAKFYLNKAPLGKGGKAGARGRLKEILARYTKYTKLDEVLSLLGQLHIDEDYLEDAAACYRRLIHDFPTSQYAGEASIQLSIIEVMKVNQRP